MAISEQPVGTVATPNNLTESSAGSSSTPVNLTESTSGSVDTPANLTESSVVSASTPVNLTESTSGAVATPVNLTESSVGSTATPVNLAESGAGSIAVPVNLAEQAVASIPRPLVPLVGMDFTKNRYAQDGGEVAFDDLFTYSRNSNATYWNRRLDQNGKWETFLDTDIVGSVENLQLHSESFDHSDWGKSNLTVIANATNNHFGVKLADEIVEDDYNGTHILSDGNAFTSGSTYAFSVYVKANGRGQVRISAGNLTTFDASSDFDINSGVVLRSLNGHASITYERDGWWRCTVIGLSSSTGTTNVNIYPAIGLNTNYQGDGISGVYIWGAQLTESAKPLPYIKTTSSTTAQTIVELPRIEYDPVTAEAKGVLIEGANTNVATYSEDFTHSNWIKTSSTISENEHIAPDGTISMDRITPSAVTNGRISHLNITLSTSTEYNLSCYMKNIDSTRSKILLYGSSGAGVKGDLFINWTGGVPSEQQSNNATGISFQDCGNGIWRISATFTSDATVTNHAPYVYPDVDTGTGEIYLWGVQLEKHPHASSYIRTEGVAASRVADNLQASGYGNTNSSIGTLFLEGAPYAATTGTQNVLNINDGTTNNRVVIRATSATNKTNTLVVADGVTEAQFSTADNWDSSQKTVLTYEQDSVVTYIDGLALNTDTSATMPTGITTIDIGQSSASQKQWYGHISSTEIYEEAMTAQEVSLIGSGSIKARTMLSDVMTTPSSSAYSGYKYSLLDYAKIDGSNMTGIDVGDNVTIKMGDGDDLRIYHGGSNSYIDDTGTGNLIIKGQNVVIDGSNNERIATFAENGAVTLKYDNGTKFATTSTGINVTGEITSDGIALGDSDKATFGAGDDIQIYHSGSHNFIEGNGVGNIYLRNKLDDADVIIQSDDGSGGHANYIMADGSNGEVRLFHYGDEKLNTTSTGIDVTGTATMDGLTVDANTATFSAGTSGDMEVVIQADTDNNNEGDSPSLVFKQDGGNTIGRVGLIGNADDVFTGSLANALYMGNDELANLQFYTNLNERLRIASNGDISFYEDTGTTPKLFWDASAERLGIGTSSPSGVLDVSNGTNSFNTGANADRIQFKTAGLNYIQSEGALLLQPTGDLVLNGSGSEIMRLKSGNVLVGTDSAVVANSSANVGTAIGSGLIESARAGVVAQFNRHSDGSIVELQKDGTTVGTIGTGGGLYFAGANGGFRVHSGGTKIFPCTASNATKDNAIDLGAGDARFKDAYLSGGVYLGGTGAANKLDDYEEGTFTAVLSDSATGGNLSGYSVRNARYTKVGRTVTVVVNFINITTVGMTASNLVYLQGLPFSVVNVSLLNFVGSQTSTGITGAPNIISAGGNSTSIYTGISAVSDIASGTADYYVTLTYEAA